MSVNPYPNTPVSRGGTQLYDHGTHASIKAVYASENQTTSSVITLSPDTTAIEISAIGASPTGAVMRWVTSVAGFDASTSVISAAGTANFDHVIPNNTMMKFAVPIEKMYQSPSSMVGANIQNGLYRRIAIKSIGVGSVLLNEF